MASTIPSLFSLSGKTAIVTGGTRGIGQAMAIGLAEAGADIILVQVRPTREHPANGKTVADMKLRPLEG